MKNIIKNITNIFKLIIFLSLVVAGFAFVAACGMIIYDAIFEFLKWL